MIQRCNGPCFLLESGAMATFELLHRDDAIQARVTSLPNLAHASRAERRNDLVRPSLSPTESGTGVIYQVYLVGSD